MKKKRKMTGGTTMVEVMVAFVVLVLLMGMFSQAMGLAGRMMNRSADTLEKYHQLAGDYFLNKTTSDDGDIEIESIPAVLSFKRVTKDGKETGDGFSVQAEVRTYTKTIEGGNSAVSLYGVENAVKAETEEGS